MVKKSACLLFVLIANILLVAHSILPHEHFGGFAWIPADHCEDHHHPAGNHAEDADHHHPDQDHDQPCLLAQAYLVRVNSFKPDFLEAESYNQGPDFQLIFSDRHHWEYPSFFNKIPLPPLILPGRSPSPSTSCSGLRAPPTL